MIKRISFLAFLLLSLNTHSQLTPERTQLYHCAPKTPHPFVEGTRVYESSFGSRSFYEIEVLVLDRGVRSSYFKKVHLNSTYEGRILTFGTGNFRVKIDHVFPTRGKFKAFARIPRYNIHSQDWSCKKS